MIAVASPEVLPLTIKPGQRLTITIPWPRFPLITPSGKLSKSGKAGSPYPWLSANNVNRLKPIVHHQYRAVWREAAKAAALKDFNPAQDRYGLQVTHRVRIEIVLYRGPNARRADVGGVLEGVKPLLDGIVLARILPGDTPDWVAGLEAGELIHVKRGREAVALWLRAA